MSNLKTVPDLRGARGGTCPPPPPRRGCECPKNNNNNKKCALYDIASIYCNKLIYLITDYPQFCWKKRRPWGHRQGCECYPGFKWWDFKPPVVWSWRIKRFCAPSQSQTKLGNLVWVRGGHLSPVPPPHLPLQIPCRLVVAKPISNSCAPSPDQTQRNLKESRIP